MSRNTYATIVYGTCHNFCMTGRNNYLPRFRRPLEDLSRACKKKMDEDCSCKCQNPATVQMA